jgi:hypothetical protein
MSIVRFIFINLQPYNQVIEMKKFAQISLVCAIIAFGAMIVTPNSASAQINKNKKKSMFASTGNKWTQFRYGILGQVGSDFQKSTFVGVGFGANQYYGVGNLMFQQSVSYQVAFGNTIRHNIEVSIHNNFFGGFDFSPFVWGANAMFVKDENVGQLFVRPDFGIGYPFKYRDRASEETKYTIMLLYGYNFMLFEDRNNMGISPHYVTLKVLFPLFSYHEV